MKVLVGAIALGLLLFIYMVQNGAPEGVELWFGWIHTEIIGGLLSVFFVAPIVASVINLRLPREMLVLSLIGGAIVVIYKYVTDTTWIGLLSIILSSVVMVSLFSLAFNGIYRLATRRLPP